MAQITLFQAYQDRRERVERQLRHVFETEAQHKLPGGEAIERIREAETDFVLSGGKRIRGILTLLGYEWHSGEVPSSQSSQQAIDQVAAAAELFHAALLVHDDIIDRDQLRRGRKTLHQVELIAGSTDEHQRLSLALLSGDQLATLAYKTLLSAEFPLDRKFAAIKAFEEEAFLTGLGAILDVDAVRRSKLPKERLARTSTLKTARYTTVAPFRIGAELAGTQLDPSLERILTQIGEAFQLRDDLFSIFAAAKTTGKTAHSDLREGRQTLLLTLIEQTLSKGERKALRTFLGGASKATQAESEKNKAQREKQAVHFAELLKERGLEAEAEKEIGSRWERIERAITKLEAKTNQKTLLLSLGRQLLFRAS